MGHKKTHIAAQLEPAVSDRDDELEAVVPAWLSVPEAAELQGMPLSAVRRQLQDRELVAVRRGPNKAVMIPAAFVTAEGPLHHLPGTITVLADGGMAADEIVIWLFTYDETLDGGSTPMEQLARGRKTEVRKRAMETAY